MFLTRILTKSIPNTVKPALGALLPDSFSTDFSIYTIQESIQEPTPYIQDTQTTEPVHNSRPEDTTSTKSEYTDPFLL